MYTVHEAEQCCVIPSERLENRITMSRQRLEVDVSLVYSQLMGPILPSKLVKKKEKAVLMHSFLGGFICMNLIFVVEAFGG